MTNEDNLIKKLTHHSYNLRNIYNVVLNKSLANSGMEKLGNGTELEGVFVAVDNFTYTNSKESKKVIDVIFHSGINRI